MRNKFFIFLLSLFSIFIFSDNVSALTFTANNNKEYTVNLNDSESFRDYCYFKFVKPGNKKNLIVFSYDNSFYCLYNSTSDFTIFGSSSSINLYYDARPVNYLYSQFSFDGSLYLENDSKSSSKSIYYNNIYYTNDDILIGGGNPGNFFNKNFTYDDIENKYIQDIQKFHIKYYLNNVLYDDIVVDENSSHILLSNPVYNSVSQIWSGWQYDSNIDFSHISSDIIINGTISDKNIYHISYYLNNELYRIDSVYDGDSYSLLEYLPPKNYNFSGWQYDSNIDFSHISSDINIYGTNYFVGSSLNYNENINSIVHNLSIKILGNNIPVEFDFLYIIMDYFILLIIVLSVLSPFIILFKIIGGGL